MGTKMKIEENWQDLKTKGFVVVRNFFSDGEIARQLKNFESSPKHSTKQYDAIRATPDTLDEVKVKLENLLPSIKFEGAVDVNRIVTGIYFRTEKIKLPWYIDYHS
jgi:hypothetical protein